MSVIRKVDGCQEVIAVAVQQFVVHGHTGCYEFRHPAFYDALGEFWVFQLVADRHPIAGLDELVQVGVEGVMRKAGQFGGCRVSVVPFGQRNAQHRRRAYGIFAKGFVEITHPEEQDGIRVALLDRLVLLHERRFRRAL